MTISAAELLVRCLEAHDVQYVFGIPGAKVDSIFNALEDSSIQLILCRHEQNAAFMAAAYGRLTGNPGVVLVTSGPGVGNLCTGLLTATTEGDPVVAIGGNVPRAMLHKASHQSAKNVSMMSAVTKNSEEIYTAENLPEAVANAFQCAKSPKAGASFLSFPQDVLQEMTDARVIAPSEMSYTGLVSTLAVERAAEIVNKAQNPVLLLGLEASRPENTAAIRAMLTNHKLPVVSTFQAAGAISKDLLDCFYGRVGLFHNQPGDRLLDMADLVVTVGYNPVEYDPEVWNSKEDKRIIHIDYNSANIHHTYQAEIEVLGDIAANIDELAERLGPLPDLAQYQPIQDELQQIINSDKSKSEQPNRIHPLRFIRELHNYVGENTILTCDIGTHYMWLARYFISHIPHQMLFSNGQQTLGVGFPWGMAAKFAFPEKTVLSVSGDGGFLFSGMELETAVRHGLHTVHFVWVDGSYNMVKEQEVMKYDREAGVSFGYVDIVKFADTFGAKGLRLEDISQFGALMQEALAHDGPVLIEVPIDYSDNPALFAATDPYAGH